MSVERRRNGRWRASRKFCSIRQRNQASNSKAAPRMLKSTGNATQAPGASCEFDPAILRAPFNLGTLFYSSRTHLERGKAIRSLRQSPTHCLSR